MKRYYIKKSKLNESKNFFTLDDLDSNEVVNPVQVQADKVNNAPLIQLFQAIWDFLDKGSSEDSRFQPDKVFIYVHRSSAYDCGNFFFSTDFDIMNHYYKYSNDGPYDPNILNRAYMPGFRTSEFDDGDGELYSSKLGHMIYKRLESNNGNIEAKEFNEKYDWPDLYSPKSREGRSPFTELLVTDKNETSDWLVKNSLNLMQVIWQKINELVNGGHKRELFCSKGGDLDFAFPYLRKEAITDNQILISVPSDMHYMVKNNGCKWRLRYTIPNVLRDNKISFSKDFYITSIFFGTCIEDKDALKEPVLLKCLPEVFNNVSYLMIGISDSNSSRLKRILKNDLSSLNKGTPGSQWFYGESFPGNYFSDFPKGRHVFLAPQKSYDYIINFDDARYKYKNEILPEL